MNEAFMARAIELAERGRGYTATNPSVGAVVVKDGKIVGEGWHKNYGGPHAEPNALSASGEAVKGADLYVTLEPCSTTGKTPPCTSAIINAGIRRVFVGVIDPNPKHSGLALTILREAGLDVYAGLLAQECAGLIEDFTKLTLTGFPYVTMKVAQSLDGKIATHTGESKWITSPESLLRVHELRKKADAVLIGIGTALVDNPSLTVRHVDTDRQPARVILDGDCRLPAESALARSANEVETIVLTKKESCKNAEILKNLGVKVLGIACAGERLDLGLVLMELRAMNMMNILVEGGSKVFSAFMESGFTDKLHLFTAPFVIGGEKAASSFGGSGLENLKNARRLIDYELNKSGEDIWLTGRFTDYTGEVLKLFSDRKGS